MTTKKLDGSWLSVNLPAQLSNAYIDNVNISEINLGQMVWVEALKTWFRYDTAVTLVADGITVVDDANNSGQFVRDGGYNDKDWLSQAVWYIDGTNGDDTNDGLTALTAILTWAELVRRLGAVFYVQQFTNIYVLNEPSDLLSWEVRYKGPESFFPNFSRPAVIIERSRTEVAAPLTTAEVPVVTSNEIGNFITSTAGAFDETAYPILRAPDTGLHAYVVIAESIDSNVRAALCSPISRIDGVFLSEPYPQVADTLQAFYPGVTNIERIVCDPGAVVVESGLLTGYFEGVRFFGCLLTGCNLRGCVYYSSIIEASTHNGVETATASRHINVNRANGTLYLGTLTDTSALGSLVNYGRVEIAGSMQVEQTFFENNGSVKIWLDSLFGGVSGGAPDPNVPGPYYVNPGSTTELTNTTIGVLSVYTARAGSLAFGVIAPQTVDPTTIVPGPAAVVATPNNWNNNPTGLLNPGDFDNSGRAQLLELSGGGRIAALD